MRLPLSSDYCTIAWAAEHLGWSMRSVTRAVADGRLDAVTPLCGKRESKRHKSMLKTDQVREYRRALMVITGG